MTIVVVDTPAPAETEPPAETVENAGDSEPADPIENENADEPSNDVSDATTVMTIVETTAATTEQDGSPFAATDVCTEVLKQSCGEASISVFLSNVPDAGLLDRQDRTLLNDSAVTVDGQVAESGRFLFHQIDTSNSLFSSSSGDGTNSDGNGFGLQRDALEKRQLTVEQVVVGSSAVVSTGVSVGYVMWLLRGGSLLTTFLSSLPAWQTFDPLAVLESFDEKRDDEEDDESLASLISNGE